MRRLTITFLVRRCGALGRPEPMAATITAPAHLVNDPGERCARRLTPGGGGIPWALWDWARAEVWRRPEFAGLESMGVERVELAAD